MKKIITTFVGLFVMYSLSAQIQPTKPYRSSTSNMVADSAWTGRQILLPIFNSPTLGLWADRAGQSFGLRLSNNRLSIRGVGQWLEYPTYTEVQSMISAIPSSVTSVFGRNGSVTAQSADYSSFYPLLSGSYTNPTWISSIAWGKITGTPTTLSGYGIIDAYPLTGNPSGFLTSIPTLQQTTSAGNTTTNLISLGGTTAPTNTLTFPSTASGIALYNTSDQMTNYERFRLYASSNNYYILSESAGTGTVRDLNFGNATKRYVLSNSGLNGSFHSYTATTTGTTSIMGLSGTASNSSGVNNSFLIVPTFNQTGTAAYRGMWMSVYEQSVGSGPKMLLDLGTSTAPLGAAHTTRFSVDNTGVTTANSFIKTGGTSTQFLKADGSVDANTYATAASLSGYVPTTRTVTGGNGLNGGGDLSANRTLSVDTTVIRTVASSFTKAQTNTQIANATNALTASNGITRSGNDFQLGGLVSNNPELIFIGGTGLSMRAEQLGGRTGGFFNLANPLDGNNSTAVSFGAIGSVGPAGGTTKQILITENQMVVSDSKHGQGLVNADNINFFANSTPKSLTPKEYVDSRTASVVEVASGITSYTASSNQIIIPHSASLTTITASSTTTIGSLIQIIGEGSGGWRIQLPAGFTAKGVGISTTAGGTLSSTDRYCTITLRLAAPNTYVVTSSQGTITPS